MQIKSLLLASHTHSGTLINLSRRRLKSSSSAVIIISEPLIGIPGPVNFRTVKLKKQNIRHLDYLGKLGLYHLIITIIIINNIY